MNGRIDFAHIARRDENNKRTNGACNLYLVGNVSRNIPGRSLDRGECFRPRDKGAVADEQATRIHSGYALLAPIARSLTKKGSKGRERSRPAPTCQTRVFAAAIIFYNGAFHRNSTCHISVRFVHEKPSSNIFCEILYMCRIFYKEKA